MRTTRKFGPFIATVGVPAASRSVDRLLVLCTEKECDEFSCCSDRYNEAVGC